MKNLFFILFGIGGLIILTNCTLNPSPENNKILKITKTEIQLASGEIIEFPEPGSGISTMFIVKPGKHDTEKDYLSAELTTEGFEYADNLKAILHETDIHSVMAVATRFAQNTALPTAKDHGTKVFTYNDIDYGAYLDYVYGIEKGKKFLVVEYAAKIPDLLLTHTAREKYSLIPDGVYDKLYVVISSERGKATVHELKF